MRLVAGIALAIFVFRALIPAGFMPDAKALAEGRFELVICTASGERVVHVIDLGSPDSGGSNDPEPSSFDDCPYNLALGKIYTTSAATPVLVEFAIHAHGFGAAAAFLFPPALGPPLGQRAPPQHLV